MIEKYELANDNSCTEKVAPAREWYEQEIKKITYRKRKIKKISRYFVRKGNEE